MHGHDLSNFFKEDIFLKACFFSFPANTRIAVLLKEKIVFKPTVKPNFGTSFKIIKLRKCFHIIGSCAHG